ncbi:MAG: phosphoenolpyruvate--protein phosphotransferase [Magnetovibrionaceae bacterium]
MPHNAPSTRRLLSRVRDLMAGELTAEERLQQIVSIIAADMVSEVCSVYVRRPGDVLELFATEGLKVEAVHQTRLRIGEGIVGFVAAHARAIALADAQSHPNFAYRPETGEDIYHSMMGVPILRGGRVIGILSIQNKSQRNYSEEEVETLQTVAMIVAELILSGELIDRSDLLPADGIALRPLRLEGISLAKGFGIGEAVLHEPHVSIANMIAEDPDAERARLRQALSEMRGALDAMLDADDLSATGEHREILESYRMFAEDRGWVARIGEAIDGGLTAEAAVQRVHNDIRARLGQASDPYIRERVHDLEDLANRLVQHLTGNEIDPTQDLPEDVVLIARNMGPAQLLDYDRTRLRALVLEEGSATSHVAIVARALGIPMVGGVADILARVEPGDPMVVDGEHAQVFVRPGEDVLRNYFRFAREREKTLAAYDRLRDKPTVTRDGTAIQLGLNAGLLIDMTHLGTTNADGVGLYRTEVPFMVRPSFPDVNAQKAFYAKVLEEAGDKPVVFRTLDVGGDKVLPYWKQQDEENPAMGWRAIRVSLDRPAILRQQLRAMLRAANGRALHIMFPMVAELSEFEAAKALLEWECAREAENGTPMPSPLKVGVMIEVPSLVFQLPLLLNHVDFIAIGSNDLFQFLFAADRGNTRLNGRYDLLSPFVLQFLRDIVRTCDECDVPVSVCGEMAGSPLEAMALIGVGLRRLSVAPQNHGPVKAMLLSLDVPAITDYVATLNNLSLPSVRDHLRAFAQDHKVQI